MPSKRHQQQESNLSEDTSKLDSMKMKINTNPEFSSDHDNLNADDGTDTSYSSSGSENCGTDSNSCESNDGGISDSTDEKDIVDPNNMIIIIIQSMTMMKAMKMTTRTTTSGILCIDHVR